MRPITHTLAHNEHSNSKLASGNIGLGFGLTAMSAAASALGSLTPFLDLLFPYIPCLSGVKITESKGFLAGSFSFSAGILLFLTLGDLFPESISSFKESRKFDRKFSSILASSIFIITVLIIMLSKKAIKVYREDEKTEVFNNIDDSKNNVLKEEVKIGEKDLNNEDNDIVSPHTARKLKHLGVSIAIALAIHKIPEGLIISLPIYYATQSRLIAFSIAASVGVVSQMLGAILGYVLFVTVWNSAVSGFLFAIVTGFLLYIILHGMLPLARSYDPKDKYCTYYLFAGLFFFCFVESIFDLA
ncbi:7107_t:CDS:2 [Diversispora eburnea]|uniref:7107_t:CDS:1 n=1 Tax=Diversispora eburnea TaxID=1213867 RepID=A0A9N9G2E0_9GLOM|nr:7107_t:CDS:2 [Diversispora eburnea]